MARIGNLGVINQHKLKGEKKRPFIAIKHNGDPNKVYEKMRRIPEVERKMKGPESDGHFKIKIGSTATVPLTIRNGQTSKEPLKVSHFIIEGAHGHPDIFHIYLETEEEDDENDDGEDDLQDDRDPQQLIKNLRAKVETQKIEVERLTKDLERNVRSAQTAAHQHEMYKKSVKSEEEEKDRLNRKNLKRVRNECHEEKENLRTKLKRYYNAQLKEVNLSHRAEIEYHEEQYRLLDQELRDLKTGHISEIERLEQSKQESLKRLLSWFNEEWDKIEKQQKEAELKMKSCHDSEISTVEAECEKNQQEYCKKVTDQYEHEFSELSIQYKKLKKEIEEDAEREREKIEDAFQQKLRERVDLCCEETMFCPNQQTRYLQDTLRQKSEFEVKKIICLQHSEKLQKQYQTYCDFYEAKLKKQDSSYESKLKEQEDRHKQQLESQNKKIKQLCKKLKETRSKKPQAKKSMRKRKGFILRAKKQTSASVEKEVLREESPQIEKQQLPTTPDYDWPEGYNPELPQKQYYEELKPKKPSPPPSYDELMDNFPVNLFASLA